MASETIVLVLKPLIFFCQNGRSILCTILRIYCQEIKSVVILYQTKETKTGRISYCGTTVSALLLNFLFILFILFFLFRFFTISRKSADYSTLRFSFSIAQHIQNNEGTCVVLRFLEALFSPHNLTSGHDYCRFWAKRNCEIITMLLRKSSVWSICCSLSFLNTNEQLIFMRFCER